MAIDFFQKEVEKLQDRFNATFGRHPVCSKQQRCRIILNLVAMGLLARRINRSKHKDAVRSEIKDFVKKRDSLKRYFDDAKQQFENQVILACECPDNGNNDICISG